MSEITPPEGPDTSEQPDRLLAQLEDLSRQLERLNRQRFFRAHDTPSRALGYQVLRGIAFGLGSVLGASVVVSALVFALAQINFIPIIGDWAAQIAARLPN